MTDSLAAPSPIAAHLADPSLLSGGGRFWLYPTTDGTEDWASRSFSVWSSDDLVAWTDHGEVLRLGDDVQWARSRAWAPAIHSHEGRYFLYFTAEMNIGVATADRPEGPFRDLGHPLVGAGELPGAMIDPSVFVDDDGAAYLLWGNTWLHMARLGSDFMSLEAGTRVSWQPTGFREAAWMHKFRGTYYLSWSENDTRDASYRVRYATASSLLGPWRDRGVLVEQLPALGVMATGHHAILRVPGTDDHIIAYHRFALDGGDGHHREVVFDLLRHTSDGGLERIDPGAPALRYSAPRA